LIAAAKASSGKRASIAAECMLLSFSQDFTHWISFLGYHHD
jgi:hypothetical protein